MASPCLCSLFSLCKDTKLRRRRKKPVNFRLISSYISKDSEVERLFGERTMLLHFSFDQNIGVHHFEYNYLNSRIDKIIVGLGFDDETVHFNFSHRC